MARILPLHRTHPEEASRTARAVADAGGVLAVPTESYYALAASAWQPGGLRRVNEIKGRPAGKPLLLLIAEAEQVHDLVESIPPAARVLIERCWPGPLTLVLPAGSRLSEELTAGTGTIGLRQPRLPSLMPLLQAAGPLTGTSANRSGADPVTTAGAVEQALGDVVDLILDGGPTPGGPPSTLVDTRDPVRLLREGAFPRARLEAILRAAGFQLEGGEAR